MVAPEAEQLVVAGTLPGRISECRTLGFPLSKMPKNQRQQQT